MRCSRSGITSRAERAVVVQEALADVEVEDHLVVGQLLDNLVGALVDLAAGVVLVGTPGKMARTSTFVLGSLARSFLTIASIPSAISSEVLSPELFVPIISTASLGEMPSTLPLSSRQRTCCVRSPPIPRFHRVAGV